jgi:hypothetical protein
MLIKEAIDCAIINRLSFWDALIVVAAESAHCEELWTEDLNPGQVIRGVRIENPLLFFLAAKFDILTRCVTCATLFHPFQRREGICLPRTPVFLRLSIEKRCICKASGELKNRKIVENERACPGVF